MRTSGSTTGGFRLLISWMAFVGVLLGGGCRTVPESPAIALSTEPAVTTPIAPRDDEIIVAGQRFATGTRVVTWLEPDGYNAYRKTPPQELRQPVGLTPEDAARVRERGWDLKALQQVVDQFVLHYDAEGLSRNCFDVLGRVGLSVHFLLDVDGTIYQTLDLQERASHATIANSRSVGIEIANIGAYPPGESSVLREWYRPDATGGTVISVPARIVDAGIRTSNFTGRPARPKPVRGVVQGKELVQYDFTPEQYAALAKLTATLCRVLPRIACEVPRDPSGGVVAHKLSAEEFARYRGVLAHFHIQENKVDPGPALQWDRFLAETREQAR